MVALLRTLSLRYLRKHSLRTLLIIISIALGVATLVATRVLNQSMVKAAKGAATPLADLQGLMLTNDVGVDRGLVKELREAKIPGLKEVRPLILERVAIPELNNQTALLVGAEFDPLHHGENPWGLVQQPISRPFAFPLGTPVLVGSHLENSLPNGAAEFTVKVAGETKPVSGFNTVDARSHAAILGGSVIFTSLDWAANLVGKPKMVTRIDLVLDESVPREQVQSQIKALVGHRASLTTPEMNDRSLHKVTGGLELGFQLSGLCALVVGLLLVYNALSVSVAERRHDIGIMRSLGATRWQIAQLFLGEAGLLGLVGSLVGVPLGVGLAYLTMGPFQSVLTEAIVRIDERRIDVPLATLALAVVAGVATAMLAALIPATKAASEEPADAVRRVPQREGLLGRLVPVGGCLLLLGTAFVFFTFRHQLPERMGTYGGILLAFMGSLVVVASVSALIARMLQPVARLLFPVTERLASDNLIRSPGRTGLVIASLAAFVALMMQTAGVTESSKDAILTWVDHSIAAHLFVSNNSPVTSNNNILDMKESIGQNIATLPAVKRVAPVRFKQVKFREDEVVFLIALDPAFYSPGMLATPLPGLELIHRLREPGSILVSENFAILHGVRGGELITLPSRHGPRQFHVLGTVKEYSWPRGTLVMDRDQYMEHFNDDLVNVFDIYVWPEEEQLAKKISAALSTTSSSSSLAGLPWGYLAQSPEPESIESVRETILRRWGVEDSLVVITRPELRDNAGKMIERLYSIGYAQEAVVGLVAAMGVVTALLISVLQRRRELGLLRAMGASRWQILRSVLAEAMLMGLIGAICGLVIGIPMEYYAVRVILLEEAGFNFDVTIPWKAAGIVTGLAMLIATLAGLIPAFHATRLRITDAISYE